VKLNIGGSLHDPNDPIGRLFNVLAMIAEFSVISTRRASGVPTVGAAACSSEYRQGEAGVQVVKESYGGIVRRVVLLDDAGDEVALVTQFCRTCPIPDIARTRCAPTHTICVTWSPSWTGRA
jgi:hypothetical protein